MSASEFEQVMQAYRRSRWTMIGHAVFLGVGLLAIVLARRLVGLPPQVIATVIIVALVVFGRDIMKFIQLRSRVSELRSRLGSP